MGPTVEVCLVSYASGDDLLDAISSVAEHAPGATVAVQENAGSTDTLDAAARHAGRVGVAIRTLHDPSNPGFGRACNALAASSTAEVLFFLNPDARITRWPFGADRPPVKSICGPAVVEAPRAESHRGVTCSVGDEIRRSWFRRWGAAPHGSGFVSGAALLVARADFETLGGFDERFFMYYEDVEFCLRANGRGVATTVVDGFHVHHGGAHSTSGRFAQSLTWSYESANLFHRLAGHSIPAYRTYVIADSIARWLLHLVRGNASRRRGYGALARRSTTDLVTRRAP